ncbi:TPA: type-F conjugative transfer system secretin TraK [Vibrio vulnificus]|nr:type-F conjugative transfer system secretin TraK [Vibrio vulnificus]
MMRALLLFLCLLAPFTQAANTRFVTPGGQTSFDISRDEVNRIAVVDDRITSFVKIKGSFAQTHDPISGDLFITPTESTNGKKDKVISGFLTTEKGITIQVFLVLKNMPSTNTELLTRQIGHNPELVQKWERQFDDQKLAALNLARAIERYETLPGFKSEHNDKGILIRAKSLKSLTARIHGITIGYTFLAEDIRITNLTETKQPLSERFLNDKLVMGVYMIGAANRSKAQDDVFYLAPGESIRAIRIRQNSIQ